MNTVGLRKCKDCGYFMDHHDFGWCHWLGKKRKKKQDECEDGFKKKEGKK